MIRKALLSIIFAALVLNTLISHADETDEKKRESILDVIMKPVEMILAPVHGGDLADIIVKPAEAVLLPVFKLGQMVITPGRTQEYIFNINKSISVIDSEEIEQTNPRDLQQLLEQQSGIVVNRFFGNTKDNNVSMRGFGEAGLSNYVLLVDGRRTNQIDLSGPDISQIDVDSIDRIEILHGANSVLYGDNAIGGVINIITKRGEKGAHIKYTQEFGSYQYSKEYFSVDGGDDFLDYFFSYSYQDSEGYRLNNGYEANDIFTSLTVKPDDFLDIHVSSGYHKDWYGQPGALYDVNIRSDGRTGSRFPDSKAKTEDYYFTVDPRIFGEFGDHEGVLSSFVSYRSRRSNSRDVGVAVYETNHHIATLELRPKCEVNSLFYDDALENKLVFGADYFRARDRILSGDIAFTKSQLDIIKETFGIYASDNMLINKRFIINAGVRGEWAKYIFDQMQPAIAYNTSTLREAAFDGGIGYKYNEKSQIYANVARSYRLPNTDELFQSAYESLDYPPPFYWPPVVRVFPAMLNTSLKQQVANNYEIGVKDNSFDFLNVKAAYYLIDNKNEIYYDPVVFANSNYHHTIHHGFELEAQADIFESIEGYFTYTFQKAFFVGGKFASNTIPLVPRDKITGGFNVRPIDPLNINFAVNYLGSRFIASDQFNTVSKLKSHVTLDLGISFEIKNMRFFGTVRNLLNEKYYMNATRNFLGNPAFYPAPERNYEWGVSVKF
ncbi:MAG: TonB-dependent receptor [Candidatus Omnitrophota bacterium]